MADEKPEVLSFKVEADSKSAVKQMGQYNREVKKFQQSVLKSSQKMGKAGVKVARELNEANEDLIDTMGDLDEVYARVQKAQQKSGNFTDEEIKEINAATAALREKTKALKDFQESQKSEYQKALEDPKAARKMGKVLKKEVTTAFRGGFKSFLSKDAKGLVHDLGDLLKGSVKLGGLKFGAAGGAMAKRGKEMKAQAAAQGGGAGGLKAMGTMMGGVGKALEGLAKAAPLIAGLSTILVKVVSLFLDAQAQAKQFNKDILQSASTVEFFGQAQGNAAMAGGMLEDTLKQIRDAAFDAETNLDWGITSDTHKAVLNTLNQEGISLRSIGTEAAKAGKTVKDFAKELVTSSVAYSRLLGVPLQDINQLQAEMITDLGMGIQQTEQAFSQMARSATDSGIAANKFFGIIRGVSQDLSLWGSRMEDAVKLLTKLGKVMNPREAAKFMNTAMAGLKNMGRSERLRLGLLTGEKKFGKLIERDTKRKAEGLAKTLGVAVEDLADPKKLNDAINKLPEEQQGAARSAAIEMKEQMTAAGKGIFGKAIAGRTMGPAAALEAMKSALGRFSGQKKLGGMRGEIGAEMMAENLGISEEQLDQMVKFETSIDMTRDALTKTLQTGTDEEKKNARMQIKKAGIQGENDADLIKNVNEAGYDEIMDTLDDNAKQALAEGEKDPMKDFAQKQTSLQQSLMDKLTVYVDFFMNQFYDIMTDIWDAIMMVADPLGKKQGQRDLTKKVFASKDPELAKMFKAAGEDTGKFKGSMIGAGGIGAGFQKAIENFKNAKDDVQKEHAGWDLGHIADSIETGFKKMGSDGADAAQRALKSAGLAGEENKARAEEVKKLMEAGQTFSSAMSGAGFKPEDVQAAMQKAVWEIPADALVDLRETMQKRDLIGGGKPAETPAPSGQAQASSKAATPGIPAPTVMPPPTQAAPSPVAAPPAPAPAPMPPPAAPTGGGAAMMPPVPQEVKDYQEANLDWLGTLGGKNDDIIQILKRKVKLDKAFVRDELGPVIEDSVLKAVRVALVEYKLYKDVDMGTFQKQLTSGAFDPKTYGKDLMDAVESGTADVTETGATLAATGAGNALGGHVIGQNPDGTAKILRPPAGEMPAFVGPGETIGPRRGGGRAAPGEGVSVVVNGIGGNDLAQMVKVAATNAIYEYKRREGLH